MAVFRPAWTRRLWPGVLAASDAAIFLLYATLWVGTLATVPIVVGRRAFGQADDSPVLSVAFSVIHYSLTVLPWILTFALTGIFIRVHGIRYLPKEDIKDPLTLKVVGGLMVMAFMALLSAGDFKVIGQSRVGSILKDLAPLVIAVTQHFIIVPIPRQRRMK